MGRVKNVVDFKELAERAKKRAAELIVSWIPEKEGDNDGGTIESIQMMSFEHPNLNRDDGLTASTVIRRTDGSAFRFNWMSMLPEVTWERVKPQVGDFVWIHNHGMAKSTKRVDPKTKEPTEYHQIQVMVYDSEGREKTDGTDLLNLGNVDTSTGEITHVSQAERMELKAGEEKF